MVLSELNRRKDMRQRYQLNQTKPTATVAEEVITQTEQGLGSMMPRRQPQQMAARPQMPMQQSAIAQNQPMRMQGGGPTGRLATPEFEEYLRRREDDRKDEIIRGMKELNSARRNRAMMLDDEGSVEKMPAPYDEEEAMMRRNQEQAEYAQKLSRSLMGMKNPVGYGVSTGIGALVDMYRNKADEAEMYASGGVIKAANGFNTIVSSPQDFAEEDRLYRELMQAGYDPSSLSDKQIRQAIASIKSSGAMTAVQQDNLLRLQDELDVRNQMTQNVMASNARANQERREFAEQGLDYLTKNVANPFAALYDTVIGLPAAAVQNTTEYVNSLMSGEEPQYVGSAPAQTALFGTEPSIDLSGRPNATNINPREAELARQRLKAEKAEALAKGMEEGRLGSTDPTPQQTQAEAEETIEQILATDPSLEQDTPMVQPYPGAPTMIAGQRAPNFRTEVPAVFDDADVPTISVPDEIVADPIDEAQLYAKAFADDPAPVTKTQESGGLPLPLLLEAARFGADLADRGTRGENFLGSVAGAGKTSIDRGLKFAERQMKQQQLQNVANTKRRQGLEDFVLKEQIKRALEAPDTASISDINSTIRTFQSMLDTEQDPQKALALKEKLVQLREDLERKTGIGGSVNTQSVLQKAQAALAAQQAGSS
jgi:hypothetical protein